MKTFYAFMQEAYLIEYRRNKNKSQKSYNPEEDSEIERHGEENNLSKKDVAHLKSQARTSTITQTRPDKLSADNTDVGEVGPGAQGRRNLRRILRSYGRDPNNIKRILKQRRERKLEPAVIHQDKNKNKTVVAGNTRLSTGKVYRFSVPTTKIGN